MNALAWMATGTNVETRADAEELVWVAVPAPALLVDWEEEVRDEVVRRGRRLIRGNIP